MTVALRLADKFHGAILIVQSFPWAPDVLSIVNVIATEDGEPSSGMGICLHGKSRSHRLRCHGITYLTFMLSPLNVACEHVQLSTGLMGHEAT